MDKETTRILVVGGVSTAYHLALNGYKKVTCLDRWPFPSQSSAGFDRNKIVRTEYAEPIYSVLAEEALQGWRKFPFAPHFHETGWVYGTTHPLPASNSDGEKKSHSISAEGSFDRAVENTRRYGDASGVFALPNPKSLHEKFPYFTNTPDFRGIFNSRAGWAAAANAIQAVAQECIKMGVTFVSGDAGTVVEVVRGHGDVVGVKTKDGQVHKADKTVLACGAYSDEVIDMERQVTAVAYSVTHCQLTYDEVEKYKSMPVIDIEGYGYTFPPDQDGIIKFCDFHIGHPWMCPFPKRDHKISIPRDHSYHPTDTLPNEDVAEVRRFIRFCMPYFVDRPLEGTRMCWDTESFDCHWIISPHPLSPSRLFIATAGSGHSFKNLPNVGKYVLQCLEGNLSNEHREAWRWRPDKVDSVPFLKRVDLADLHGWKHDDA